MNDPIPDPIDIALREDLGQGDITTQFFVRGDLRALGRIVARERAVVAGAETAAEVFRRVNSTLNVEILQPDGTALSGGGYQSAAVGYPLPVIHPAAPSGSNPRSSKSKILSISTSGLWKNTFPGR